MVYGDDNEGKMDYYNEREVWYTQQIYDTLLEENRLWSDWISWTATNAASPSKQAWTGNRGLVRGPTCPEIRLHGQPMSSRSTSVLQTFQTW